MKPILLGMNNPISARPEHALYPHPPGCSGHRLWQLLHDKTGASRREYIDAFDRRDLVTGPWCPKKAVEAGRRLIDEVTGRIVVVLGQDVRKALGLPNILIHPYEMFGATWRQLPHPSGRNPWYTNPDNRALAAALLAELYHAHKS